MTAYQSLLLGGAVLAVVAAVQGVRAAVEHGDVGGPIMAAILSGGVFYAADSASPVGLRLTDLPGALGAFLGELMQLVS